MVPAHLIVTLAANEAAHAGERDYYFSVIDEMGETAKGTAIASLKSGVAASCESCLTTVWQQAHNNADYALIPGFSTEALDHLAYYGRNRIERATVIGLGHSTLEDIFAAKATLEAHGIVTRGGYVTHMVDGDAYNALAANEITVFPPLPRPTGTTLDWRPLDSVPHTNTAASCRQHAEIYGQTANGQTLRSWQDSGADFGLVVLNAGFGIKQSPDTAPVHHAYLASEACAHGIALAKLQPQNNLLLMHGGPRNLADEKDGEMTMDSFVAGLREGGSRGEILTERFVPNLPYNAIKAAYLAARAPNCRSFISNAEGYGTMDGAILHVDNSRTLLGMFNFQANTLEAQRVKNTTLYHGRGIALLSLHNGEGLIERAAGAMPTPVESRNAAADVVAYVLGR